MGKTIINHYSKNKEVSKIAMAPCHPSKMGDRSEIRARRRPMTPRRVRSGDRKDTLCQDAALQDLSKHSKVVGQCYAPKSRDRGVEGVVGTGKKV